MAPTYGPQPSAGVWERYVRSESASSAALGHRPFPCEPATLALPLEGGPYPVAAGGSNALVNPHLLTLDPHYRAYRGQSFGVDLVGLA